MPTTAQRPSRTQIADLRASVQAAREKPKFDKAPPAPRKPKKGAAELATERAEKAERQSMHQHTTSLLGDGDGKPYVRKGNRQQRSGTVLGLMFQIVFVVAFVGGITYAIDPSLMPPEWHAAAMDALDRVKAHEMVRNWWPA